MFWYCWLLVIPLVLMLWAKLAWNYKMYTMALCVHEHAKLGNFYYRDHGANWERRRGTRTRKGGGGGGEEEEEEKEDGNETGSTSETTYKHNNTIPSLIPSDLSNWQHTVWVVLLLQLFDVGTVFHFDCWTPSTENVLTAKISDSLPVQLLPSPV